MVNVIDEKVKCLLIEKKMYRSSKRWALFEPASMGVADGLAMVAFNNTALFYRLVTISPT